ncbi:uncharacterized protein LOC108118403 [Drosophila eugracilis]|uniref:uncharacterized protein LOC108118403 n=1 Tax=Drosophila eugracilis TaxID=29029 RepID=UPI001BD9F941|nr:uncharacterized protein LOC108118403 [Drosophila eugracilis]
MLSEDQESSEEAEGPCTVWRYRCSVARCPYRTNRPYNLTRHGESHVKPKESKQYGCPVCVYSTEKSSNLKRHLSVKHPGTKERLPETPPLDRNVKIQCQVMGCKYETNRPFDLKRHLSVHNNPEKSNKTFKCSLCTYSSDRKANLKRHHELRHSGIEEAIQTAEELRDELHFEAEMLEKQKLKAKKCEQQNVIVQNLKYHREQKLKHQMLEKQKQKEQLMEEQMLEVQILDENIEREDINLLPKVNRSPALPKPKENLLISLMKEIDDEEQGDIKLEFVYNQLKEEKIPIITICKPQLLHGDISNKQLIAVNMDGQLRWFQSIDPPPGAPTKLKCAVEKQTVSSQQQMDELDNELALSLAEHDQQEDFLVEMLSEEKQVEKPPTPFDLAWSWSTPDAVHHITPNIEDIEQHEYVDADFPDWWDDGKYTKMQKNQIFRDQPNKPSHANVQRILRIIYDVYYKPFKEDRKQFEAFQIKDSWLCATRMTRMQIIKDMYSKQGT